MSLVVDAISRANRRPGDEVAIAVDIAASQFYDGATYRLATEDRNVDSTELIDLLTQWCARYPIVSIEDPLHEDDWSGWFDATRSLGHRQVLGDDLFATAADRLSRGVDSSVANAVLVKPNQAGTISRAESVMRLARRAGYATVVSARSGDTEDSWIADLAVGWQAGQIKVGSTHRAERTAKWNRLLEIESNYPKARFAGQPRSQAAVFP